MRGLESDIHEVLNIDLAVGAIICHGKGLNWMIYR